MLTTEHRMQINWGVTVLLQQLLNISDKRSVEKLTTPNLWRGSARWRDLIISQGEFSWSRSEEIIRAVNRHS